MQLKILLTTLRDLEYHIKTKHSHIQNQQFSSIYPKQIHTYVHLKPVQENLEQII